LLPQGRNIQNESSAYRLHCIESEVQKVEAWNTN
jgi:hypothetical protein